MNSCHCRQHDADDTLIATRPQAETQYRINAMPIRSHARHSIATIFNEEARWARARYRLLASLSKPSVGPRAISSTPAGRFIFSHFFSLRTASLSPLRTGYIMTKPLILFYFHRAPWARPLSPVTARRRTPLHMAYAVSSSPQHLLFIHFSAAGRSITRYEARFFEGDQPSLWPAEAGAQHGFWPRAARFRAHDAVRCRRAPPRAAISRDWHAAAADGGNDFACRASISFALIAAGKMACVSRCRQSRNYDEPAPSPQALARDDAGASKKRREYSSSRDGRYRQCQEMMVPPHAARAQCRARAA